MKFHRLTFSLTVVALLTAMLPGTASDHADPMSLLNPFEIQANAEANLTDLHAFVVDKDFKQITRPPDAAQGDQLILSICMRRALTTRRPGLPVSPNDSSGLNLNGFTFRIHLDLNPLVRFLPEEEQKRKEDELAGKPEELAKWRAATNAARAMQARYGGSIERPADIADEAGLEFELQYRANDIDPDGDLAVIKRAEINGAWIGERAMHKVALGEKPVPGKINVASGIFDDPFIFPRFFRRNVVAIVTAIPLDRLPLRAPGQPEWPMLIWATTHNADQQIDHVGRSLRTQVPRFGYLNTLPPAQHRAAIQRVRKNPTLLEDAFATFVGPLFATRHFDEVPDVMIYDLNRPAKFPNGRSYPDDVAQKLADGGETLLVELALAESEQFPRATENDKPFREEFPYLALRWTNKEINDALTPGGIHQHPDKSTTAVPFAPIMEVITPPTGFNPVTKRKLQALGLVVATTGLGLVALLLRIGYHYGFQRALVKAGQPDDGGQGVTPADGETPDGSSYAELHKHVMEPKFCRPYRVTAKDEKEPLPVHDVSFWKVARGLLPGGRPSLLKSAIRRTLLARTNLRWGKNRDGVTRLIHPNGVCLAGLWMIDDIAGGTGYSGYFKEKSKGLLMARFSPARAEARRGHWRSNGLVGKLYPTTEPSDEVPKGAIFFTQEDLGGTTATHINDMAFINGPDIHGWRRGKGLFALLLTGIFFARINVSAVLRQLHEIAELYHPETGTEVTHTNCPNFMRLKVLGDYRVPGESLDVREEILTHLREKGELVLTIEVSDHDQEPPRPGTLSSLLKRHIPETSWKRIGRIRFTEAMCSHNGDFVIHFPHPKWRDDPNDPTTAAKVK